MNKTKHHSRVRWLSAAGLALVFAVGVAFASTGRQPAQISPADQEISDCLAESSTDRQGAPEQAQRQAPLSTMNVGYDAMDASESTPTLTGVMTRDDNAARAAYTRSKRNTPARAPMVKTGTIIPKDTALKGRNNYNPMTLKEDADGYYFTELYTFPEKVRMSVNLTEGTVEIPAQQVYLDCTLGPVYICPITMSESGNTYSPTQPITGTIDDKGTITLGAWGIFITDGANKNRYFNAFSSSEWKPVNASGKLTTPKGQTATRKMLVEQTSPNTVLLYNLLGNGNPMAATLGSQGAVRVQPQWMHTSNNIDYYCYAADFEANKVYPANTIMGSGTTTSLTVNNWVIASALRLDEILLTIKSAQVTLTEALTWPVFTPLSGSGTQADPYKITSANDLCTLSDMVASGDSLYNKHVVLANDIDMSTATMNFSPIGSLQTKFCGTFSGAGHSIKYFYLDGAGMMSAGLFGHIGINGTVRDLTMTDVYVHGAGQNLGTIAGFCEGVLENITVSGTLTNNGLYCGGLAGRSWKLMRNCRFSGTITGIGLQAGMAAANFAVIENCHVDADIKVTGAQDSYFHDAAGITAVMTPGAGVKDCRVSDCSVAGTLEDTFGYGYVAGIVSKIQAAKVERCYNTATLTAVRKNTEQDCYTGGIVAWCNAGEVLNCFNAGNITKTGIASEGTGGIVAYFAVGYIVSVEPVQLAQISTVRGCLSTGQVNSSIANGDKGLIGYVWVNDKYDGNPLELMIFDSYFDSQTTGMRSAHYGALTSALTGTVLPKGFSTDAWQPVEGNYPTLKNQSAPALAQTLPVLTGVETANKVASNFCLRAPQGVKWAFLTADGSLVQNTQGMKLEGDSVKLKNSYATETLIATDATGHTKTWSISSVPHFFEGSGTEEDPFLIRTVDDMKALHNAVAVENQSHEGDYFKMANDIDFAYTDEFEGIGARTNKPFGGVFDGAGHQIKRLKIHSTAWGADSILDTKESYAYAGLFNYTTASAVIRNVVIASDCDFEFYQNSAPVAGRLLGRVENCHNYARVNGVSNMVAGVVGYADKTAVTTGCYNAGRVVAGGFAAAGITAQNLGVVELCQNDGEISSERLTPYQEKIVHYRVGGICVLNSGTVDRCVNAGVVRAFKEIGGIVAANTTTNGGVLTNCINIGQVNCINEHEQRGAICGSGSFKKFENNYYDGSVNLIGAVKNAAAMGATELSSTTLLSGAPLDTVLTAEVLNYSEGKYPVIKTLANLPSVETLRSTAVWFTDNIPCANISKALTFSRPQGTTATLKNGTNFAVTDEQLTVKLPTGMQAAVDTLRAVTPQGLLRVFPLSALPKIFEGEGTAASPYLIPDTATFYAMGDIIASTGFGYTGSHFRITADLNFGKDNYRPVATGTNAFNGVLRGDNHTVTINLDNTDSKTGQYMGLFGTIGSRGEVTDLTITGTVNAYGYGASVSGNCYGTIERVTNRAAITITNSYAAGITAQLSDCGTVRQCINEAPVTITGTTKYYAAGIVADALTQTTIDSCINRADITTTNGYAAGIVYRADGMISRCVNSGKVLGKGFKAGIVYQLNVNGNIEHCSNTADIDGSQGSYIGGIAGTITAKGSGRVFNCHNTGNISAKSYGGGVVARLNSGVTVDSCTNTGLVSSAGDYCGGVVAYADAETNYTTAILRSSNTGNVAGTNRYSGGVAGYADKETIITDCFNTGNVTLAEDTKNMWVGGLVGEGAPTVTRCWNAGKVSSPKAYGVGGLIGYGVSGTNFIECFNIGDVTADSGEGHGKNGIAGGLAGYCADASFTDCYNAGTVTAPDYVAGLIGAMYAKCKLVNCYNTGKVIATTDAATTVAATASMTGTATADNITITNVYYNKDENPVAGGTDARANALIPNELFKAALGDKFIYAHACYPILAWAKDNIYAEHAASYMLFVTNGDSQDNINGTVELGNRGNVTWTWDTNRFVVHGENALRPIHTGDSWLRVTAKNGALDRTFHVHITSYDGSAPTTEIKEVLSVEYYTPQGVKVTDPERGIPVVEVITYKDGTRRSRTVIR